jgi:small subunit ribosomal protein S7
MSRRQKKFKREIKQDPVYNSVLVSMFINKILLKGKKSLAQHILYETMKSIKETNQQDPLETLKKAITNATPTVEIKSRRVGGATYQVPIEIKEERGNGLAIKFIVQAARNKSGKSMIQKLK